MSAVTPHCGDQVLTHDALGGKCTVTGVYMCVSVCVRVSACVGGCSCGCLCGVAQRMMEVRLPSICGENKMMSVQSNFKDLRTQVFTQSVLR